MSVSMRVKMGRRAGSGQTCVCAVAFPVTVTLTMIGQFQFDNTGQDANFQGTSSLSSYKHYKDK